MSEISWSKTRPWRLTEEQESLCVEHRDSWAAPLTEAERAWARRCWIDYFEGRFMAAVRMVEPTLGLLMPDAEIPHEGRDEPEVLR